MSENENAQKDINWSDYSRLQELLRQANLREDWETADKLTPIVSELAEEIGRNQELPGKRPDNPIFQKWDQKWTELREAQAIGNEAKVGKLFTDIQNLATAIDFTYGGDKTN